MQYNIMHSLRPERWKMNVEFQLQIDAIKGNRIYFKEYENLILVSDGIVGVYLKGRELKIDKSKMIQIKSDAFCPEDLLKERTKAIETSIARRVRPSNYAIKLYSEETGESCFVNEKYLKMFKGCISLYIKSKRDPVLVHRYGIPYGIIMPMDNIPKDEEER